MRWLMVVRKLDANDDRQGFVLRWIEALAARLDHLDLICQETHDPSLPANVSVTSLGKESGASRAAQAARYVGAVRRLAPQVDGVFCHMIPRYVWLAAPWARRHGKPLLLWYTHRAVSGELRLAAAFATRILTAAPGSFPLPGPKVRVMGHGIQSDLFTPAAEQAPPAVVLVARLSRIKRQDWLLRAAAQVAARGHVGRFRVVIIGGEVEHEPDYAADLRALAEAFDPALAVTFTGPLPYSAMIEAVSRCAVAVNLSPPGLFDKAALEAMLLGKPTLVTNDDFLPLLGDAVDRLYLLPDADDAALADRLEMLLRLGPDARRDLGHDLRARALAAHSLDRLMDRVVDVMREVSRR